MTSYVIWRHGAGFFSMMASILGRLHIATELQATPYIDLETHPNPYREEKPFRGTANVWEYYFEPVSTLERSMALRQNVHAPGGEHPAGIPYSMNKSPIFPEMWARYITINEHASVDLQNLGPPPPLAKTTLGVHFRGQEMRRAAGHRLPPTTGQMIGASKSLLDSHEFDHVYLATEGQQYVPAFQRAFGSRLIVSPGFRKRWKNSYTLSAAPRPGHRYMLGLEALHDALTLGSCGGLLGSGSNLSDAAEMFGATNHLFVGRISNGLNYRSKGLRHVNWVGRAFLPQAVGGFAHWSQALVVKKGALARGSEREAGR